MLKRKLAKESNIQTHPEPLTGETMKEELYDNLLGSLVRYCAYYCLDCVTLLPL